MGGAVLATLVLGGCSAEVDGPTEEEARDAGREYGEAIVNTVGQRATPEEMEDLCGQGAMEEGIVTKGREGDETDLELDAFINACREAVSQQ
jgi:hypothetical protein